MTDPDVSRLLEILPVYAKQGRPALIPVLQKAQEIYGYVPNRQQQQSRRLCAYHLQKYMV